MDSPPIKSRISERMRTQIRQKYRAAFPRPEDKEAWLSMWIDYCAPTEPPTRDILDHTWSRLLDGKDTQVNGLFLFDGDTMIGFAHYILHADTWHKGASCYVEDGYIAPAWRPRGAMLALYEAVIAQAKTDKVEKLYWMTRSDNHAARRFYDRIASDTNWIRYEYDLDNA